MSLVADSILCEHLPTSVGDLLRSRIADLSDLASSWLVIVSVRMAVMQTAPWCCNSSNRCWWNVSVVNYCRHVCWLGLELCRLIVVNVFLERCKMCFAFDISMLYYHFFAPGVPFRWPCYKTRCLGHTACRSWWKPLSSEICPRKWIKIWHDLCTNALLASVCRLPESIYLVIYELPRLCFVSKGIGLYRLAMHWNVFNCSIQKKQN